MTASFRHVVSLNLYLVALAVFAFWVYYGSLDAETLSASVSKSCYDNEAIFGAFQSVQGWFAGQTEPLGEAGQQVQVGLTIGGE